MHKESLALLLNTALFAALTSACGGAIEQTKGDVGVDAADIGSADVAPSDSVSPDVSPDSVVTGCAPILSTAVCDQSVTYPCGLPIKLKAEYPDLEECTTLCKDLAGVGIPGSGCGMVPPELGTPSIKITCGFCGGGRRPADVESMDEAGCEDPITQTLVDQTWMESASVHAFRRLGRTLTRLNAPKSLTIRAHKAARDEVRHARLVGTLARKRGGKLRPVVVTKTINEPSTYELARENLVEGCVRETLGVAYLAHQRLHATDPALRKMAEELYEDELEHAAFSWDLVTFFASKLTATERVLLREEQQAALSEVVNEVSSLSPDVASAFGLPSGHVVKALIAGLRTSLYV